MNEAASLPFARGEKEILGIATQQCCSARLAQGSCPPMGYGCCLGHLGTPAHGTGQESQQLLDLRYQPKDICNVCCPLEPERVHSVVGFCFREVFCSLSLSRMFATKTKWLPQRVWAAMWIVVPRGAAEAGRGS